MSEDTGTLVLLNDGRVILGLPPKCRVPRDEIESAVRAVDEWQRSGATLVLPFPVEVIDSRSRAHPNAQHAWCRTDRCISCGCSGRGPCTYHAGR